MSALVSEGIFREKVVENGNVVQDLDYETMRMGDRFLVRGTQNNIPFVVTNMEPKHIRKHYHRLSNKKKSTKKVKKTKKAKSTKKRK
jgi:hypothetical protein